VTTNPPRPHGPSLFCVAALPKLLLISKSAGQACGSWATHPATQDHVHAQACVASCVAQRRAATQADDLALPMITRPFSRSAPLQRRIDHGQRRFPETEGELSARRPPPSRSVDNGTAAYRRAATPPPPMGERRRPPPARRQAPRPRPVTARTPIPAPVCGSGGRRREACANRHDGGDL